MKPPQIKRKLFVQWLEAQPDERTFRYTDTRGCLICHFFKEVHGVAISAGPYTYRLLNDDCNSERLPDWLAYREAPGRAVTFACREGLGWLKRFLKSQSVTGGES